MPTDQGRVVTAPITRRYLERRATTVMHDDFSSGRIDPTKWQHRVTASGGGVGLFVCLFANTASPPRWPSGKASASRAEDPGFESRSRQDFFGVESYQ